MSVCKRREQLIKLVNCSKRESLLLPHVSKCAFYSTIYSKCHLFVKYSQQSYSLHLSICCNTSQTTLEGSLHFDEKNNKIIQYTRTKQTTEVYCFQKRNILFKAHIKSLNYITIAHSKYTVITEGQLKDNRTWVKFTVV